MKIGIITILKVGNYGAELQAYATQAVLKSLGYDAEIIDYLFYKNPDFKPEKSSKPSFQHPLKVSIKEFLYPIIVKIRIGLSKAKPNERNSRFEQFHKDHTSTSPTFRNYKELQLNCPEYDVYLTGSDQVWNPGIYSSLEPYLLSFAPRYARRIAYASSFGVNVIPQVACDFYASRLKKYAAIGVREENAVHMIKGLTGQDATWVLDPTLLLSKEQWLEVANPVAGFTNDEFVLVYELTSCSYIMHLAHRIAAKRSMRIIRICKDAAPVEKDGNILNITDAGPAEFLWLFNKASVIITNSFHGTAFAINFNKEFYTVVSAHKKNNSRQQSLLSMFDLSDRLVPEGAPVSDFSSPDFTLVNQIMTQKRLESVNFLTTAING